MKKMLLIKVFSIVIASTFLSYAIMSKGAYQIGGFDKGAYQDTVTSGCSPATITRHTSIVDTIGNSGKFGHVVANAFDSVKFASTTIDSIAMVAYTTKDTISYKAKKKCAMTALIDTIYSCAGANKNTCVDSISFVGWSGSYASSPKICTVSVRDTQTISSTAMADSFTFVDMPTGGTGDKTNGSIYWNPTARVTKTGIKTIGWRKGVKADSTYDTITIKYGNVRIDSIVPNIGHAGDTAQVYGRGFGLVAGTGTMGDSTLSMFTWSNTTFKIKIPSIDTGLYDLSLTAIDTVFSDTSRDTLVNAYHVLPTLCTLVVIAGAGGTVSPASIIKSPDSTFRDTATANSGYLFNKWTVRHGGVTFADSMSRHAAMTVTASDTVDANFRAWPTYILTMSAGTGGTVLPATGSVDSGSSTAISASPGAHYVFQKWTRSSTAATIVDSNSATTTVILTGAATVTGSFTCVAPTISYGTNISANYKIAITPQSATIGGGGVDSVKAIDILPAGLAVTKTGVNAGQVYGTATALVAKAGYRMRAYGCDSADTWDTITVSDNVPVISSVTPPSRPVTIIGNDTLRGSWLANVDTVWYGTSVVSSFIDKTDTTLIVAIPNHADGTVSIIVRNSVGRDTLINGFTYKNPKWVILEIGQSNSMGIMKDTSVQKYATRTNDNVYMWNFRTKQWMLAKEPVAYYTTNNKDSGNVGGSNMISFANQIISYFPNDTVRLINSGVGGSTLIGTNTQWKLRTNDTTYYRIAKLKCDSAGVVPTHIIWHQGESEGNAYTSSAYFSELKKLIDDYRTDFNDTTIKFIVPLFKRYYQAGALRDSILRADSMIENYHNNLTVYGCDTLKLYSDSLHFTINSQKTLGTLMAQAAYNRWHVSDTNFNTNSISPGDSGIKQIIKIKPKLSSIYKSSDSLVMGFKSNLLTDAKFNNFWSNIAPLQRSYIKVFDSVNLAPKHTFCDTEITSASKIGTIWFNAKLDSTKCFYIASGPALLQNSDTNTFLDFSIQHSFGFGQPGTACIDRTGRTTASAALFGRQKIATVGYADSGTMRASITSTKFSNLTGFTVFNQLKYTNLSASRYAWTRNNGLSNKRVISYMYNADTTFILSLENGVAARGKFSFKEIPANTYFNFAEIYDGTQSTNATKLRCLINGVSKTGTYDQGAIPTSIDTCATFWVAGDPANFLGAIDEWWLRDKPTDTNIVKTIYNNWTDTTFFSFSIQPKIMTITKKIYTVGDTVRITGIGFLSSGGTAKVNSTDATVLDQTDTTVSIILPVSGMDTIKFINSDGNFDIGILSVNANFNPRIDSIRPVMQIRGNRIKIYGKYFGSSRGSGSLKLDTVNLSSTIKTWSDTLIIDSIPKTWRPRGTFNLYLTNNAILSDTGSLRVLIPEIIPRNP